MSASTIAMRWSFVAHALARRIYALLKQPRSALHDPAAEPPNYRFRLPDGDPVSEEEARRHIVAHFPPGEARRRREGTSKNAQTRAGASGGRLPSERPQPPNGHATRSGRWPKASSQASRLRGHHEGRHHGESPAKESLPNLPGCGEAVEGVALVRRQGRQEP